jgi:hypothetical protein
MRRQRYNDRHGNSGREETVLDGGRAGRRLQISPRVGPYDPHRRRVPSRGFMTDAPSFLKR